MPEPMVLMILITANAADEARMSPADTQALVEGHSAYERALRAEAAFVDGERLRPAAEGRRVSTRDGEVRADAGPVGGDALAGYYVVRADDLDAATAIAARCPQPAGTTLDVRPIMKGRIEADKTSRPGRVFAFAVHGNAATERDWIDVMDRIDASTRDALPADRALGGVRLHAPGVGRRVYQRALFDGPFVESKEVIGGLFFLRMRDLDDAVAWARESAFVRFGTLEIRELWRS